MRNARNKDGRKPIDLYELLFFMSYFLYIFATLCSEFGISGFTLRVINIACLVGSLMAIFKTLDRRDMKSIVLLALLFTISIFLVFAVSGSNVIIYLFALSFAAKKIQKKRIIKADLLLKIFLVIAVMAGDKNGLIQGGDLLRDGSIRNSFGFHHPNFAGLIFLNIYLDIIFLRENNKKTNFLLAIPFIIVIGVIIDSRNAAYGTALAAIVQLTAASRLLNTNTKRVIFSGILVGILIIVSLYYAIAPITNSTKKLDSYLSGRITYAKAFYDYYGINLFGNEFKKYGKNEYRAEYFVLDNGYLYLLIHDGIIVFAAIMVFYMSKIKNSLKEGDDVAFSALVAFACIGLMEQAMFQPIKNPFLLLSNNTEKK